MTATKIQPKSNQGEVGNSGKLKKIDNKKISYEEIEWNAVKNLSKALQLKLIEAVIKSLGKNSEFEAAMGKNTRGYVQPSSGASLVDIPVDTRGLEFGLYHINEAGLAVEQNHPELAKFIKIFSKLNESQQEAIIESLKKAPVSSHNVKVIMETKETEAGLAAKKNHPELAKFIEIFSKLNESQQKAIIESLKKAPVSSHNVKVIMETKETEAGLAAKKNHPELAKFIEIFSKLNEAQQKAIIESLKKAPASSHNVKVIMETKETKE